MNISIDTIKSGAISLAKGATKEAEKVGKGLLSFKNGAVEKAMDKDVFQKAAQHKEAIIGYGAFLAAGILAIKCLKGIIDKIKETRE